MRDGVCQFRATDIIAALLMQQVAAAGYTADSLHGSGNDECGMHDSE